MKENDYQANGWKALEDFKREVESEKDIPVELIRMAKPFTGKLVKTKDMGNRKESYVNHAVVAQRLLMVVGPYDWDFEVIMAGDVFAAIKGTLTVTIDGKQVSVSGSGTPQNTKEGMGEQIKKAESDSFKRACAKLGLGLHLWSGDDYFLDSMLSKVHNVELTELS